MNKLVVLFLTAILGLSTTSQACTFVVDEAQKTRKLRYIAMVAVWGGDEGISISEATPINFSWVISKSTPMCPDELTHTAQFSIQYTKLGLNDTTSLCRGEVTVTNVEPFVPSEPTEETYKVVGHNSFTCE